MVAAPLVIRGKPEKLPPRNCQPSLLGDAPDLDRQNSATVAIRRAEDRGPEWDMKTRSGGWA